MTRRLLLLATLLSLTVAVPSPAQTPAPPATEVQISCTWSGDPAVDCPDMP